MIAENRSLPVLLNIRDYCAATFKVISNPSNYMDNFIKVPVSAHNLDRWIIRSEILKQIEQVCPRLKGDLLDVGCGKMPYREHILGRAGITRYVGLDLATALVYDTKIKPDAVWDGVAMPFADRIFDCVMATEVFEHASDLSVILKEIKRVLKPGGLLFFTTPFVWPYHEVPHDHQRWTSFGMRYQLTRQGFNKIEVLSIGNWHSCLAQVIGLWGARAPMPRWLRSLLCPIIFLIQRWLIRHDATSQDLEQAMPRMISGTAHS